MNKQELVTSIAIRTAVSHEQGAKMLTAMQESVKNTLRHGDKVSIRGFGRFAISDHATRRCRHPKTGDVMQAKAYRTVRFVPAEEIKSSLN